MMMAWYGIVDGCSYFMTGCHEAASAVTKAELSNWKKRRFCEHSLLKMFATTFRVVRTSIGVVTRRHASKLTPAERKLRICTAEEASARCTLC
jgi:hypothetical protein